MTKISFKIPCQTDFKNIREKHEPQFQYHFIYNIAKKNLQI